jgi:hypothetical protein
MLAVIAAILFAVAFILHVVGHSDAKLVWDFVYAGLVFIALALAFGSWAPWVRPRP